MGEGLLERENLSSSCFKGLRNIIEGEGGFIKPIVGTIGENVHRGNVQAGYGVRMADVALSSW